MNRMGDRFHCSASRFGAGFCLYWLSRCFALTVWWRRWRYRAMRYGVTLGPLELFWGEDDGVNG